MPEAEKKLSFYWEESLSGELLRHAFSNGQLSSGTSPKMSWAFYETNKYSVVFDADHESDLRFLKLGSVKNI